MLRAQRAVPHSHALLRRLTSTVEVTEQNQIDREVRDSEQSYLRKHQQALLDAEPVLSKRPRPHG